jgi:hypothetical protein
VAPAPRLDSRNDSQEASTFGYTKGDVIRATCHVCCGRHHVSCGASDIPCTESRMQDPRLPTGERGRTPGRQGDRARDHHRRFAPGSNSPYRTAPSGAVTRIRFWAGGCRDLSRRQFSAAALPESQTLRLTNGRLYPYPCPCPYHCPCLGRSGLGNEARSKSDTSPPARNRPAGRTRRTVRSAFPSASRGPVATRTYIGCT